MMGLGLRQVAAFLGGMGFCVRSLSGGGFLRPERYSRGMVWERGGL